MRPAVRTVAAMACGTVGLGLSCTTAATTWVEVEHTCPIGGEEFTALEVASNSYFGSRPDGKPYSPLPVTPIPECPGNGLLLFDEFSQAELNLLESAITSQEFAALRAVDTPRYRTAWLMERIGEADTDIAYQRLVAIWEADGNTDLKIRYQAEFVTFATGIPRTEDNAGAWLLVNARAANVLRELGYWEESLTLIDRINLPAYMPEDAEETAGIAEYFAGLRALVAERNYSPEPANMIPETEAIFRCGIAVPELTASEWPVCQSADMQERIAEFEVEDDSGEELRGREAFEYVHRRSMSENAGVGS